MTNCRWKKILLILVTILVVSGYGAYAQTASLIAKNTFPSVVLIQTVDEDGVAKSQGSGFFVRPNIVVTNYHVIKGAFSASLKQVGYDKVHAVSGIVGVDKTNDLALLTVGGLVGKPLPLVTDLTKIEVGEEIFALGNPQGLEGTISPGIISSKRLRSIGDENLIQITAPISPGSSGGPVVNKLGQVVGVASGSLKSGQNLNFAVPAVYVNRLLDGSMEVITFSEFLERDLPSLEETVSWLTKALSGHRGPTFSDSVITDTRMNFKGCDFEYWNSSEGIYSSEVVSSFHLQAGTMMNLKYVGPPPGTMKLNTGKQINGTFLAFTFSEKGVESSYRWPTRPEYNRRNATNNLYIYLSDKRLGPSVEKAFLRMQSLCAIQ